MAARDRISPSIPSLMGRLKTSSPRLSVRDVLVWTTLIAVGLAIAGAGAYSDVDDHLLYPNEALHFQWHTAFLFVVSAAMACGLFAEIRMLRSIAATAPSLPASCVDLFPQIVWRCVVGSLLVISLATLLFVRRGVVQHPERTDLSLVGDPLSSYVWLFCVVIVLASSLRRWTTLKSPTNDEYSINLLAWFAGGLLAAIVLSQLTFITFLVHVATAAVEHTHSLRLQRAHTYPHHAREGFRLFWISFGALLFTVVAGVMLWRNLPTKTRRTAATAKALIACGMLAAVGVFDGWYFGWEAYRISPDLAGAGFTATWFDGIGACILVVMLAGVAALKRCEPTMCEIDAAQPVFHLWRQPRMHESPVCLVFVVGAVVAYLAETVRSCAFYFLETRTYEAVSYVFLDVYTYIALAVCLLGIQLCAARWRRRRGLANADLPVVHTSKAATAFAAMLLLAVVGVPAIAAFCFNVWLGPWYMF